MNDNKYDIEFEKKIMNLIDSNQDAVEIYNLVQNANVKKGFPFLKTGLFVSLGIIVTIAIYFYLFSNNITQQLQPNVAIMDINEELNKSNIQIESTHISNSQIEKERILELNSKKH